MISFLLLLAFASPSQVSFTPSTPTVGDQIALVFSTGPSETIRIDPSASYEIVSITGNRAVVRAFQPGDIVIQGEIRGPSGVVKFDQLKITIRSVLEVNDKLEPAPLAPPLRSESPRAAPIAIGVALAAAAAAWGALLLLLRGIREIGPVVITLGAVDEYRAALERLRGTQGTVLHVELADATRRYLARTDQRLSSDLSSREMVGALRIDGNMNDAWPNVAELLRAGDHAKFAPTAGKYGDPSQSGDALALAFALIEQLQRGEEAS